MPEGLDRLEVEINRLGQEVDRLRGILERHKAVARREIDRLYELGDHLHRGGLEKARKLQQEAIQGLRGMVEA